jgi:hypothetical protein
MQHHAVSPSVAPKYTSSAGALLTKQKGTELVGKARNASASDQTNRTPDHVERRSHPIDAFEDGGPALPFVQLGRLSFHLDRLHEDLELTVDVVAGNLAVQSTKDRLALFMMSS